MIEKNGGGWCVGMLCVQHMEGINLYLCRARYGVGVLHTFFLGAILRAEVWYSMVCELFGCMTSYYW